MKSLTVRIDDNLHKELKLTVVHKDTTIQDYIVELIKKDLDQAKYQK